VHPPTGSSFATSSGSSTSSARLASGRIFVCPGGHVASSVLLHRPRRGSSESAPICPASQPNLMLFAGLGGHLAQENSRLPCCVARLATALWLICLYRRTRYPSLLGDTEGPFFSPLLTRPTVTYEKERPTRRRGWRPPHITEIGLFLAKLRHFRLALQPP